MARTELVAPDEVPEEYRDLFSEDYVGNRNVIRLFANDPPLLESLFACTEVMTRHFTPREEELIVLATARAYNAEYEWHQHVDLAHDAGISTAEIRAIGRDDFTQFSDDERALLRYTDAVASAEMTDDRYADVAAVYDSAQLVALQMFIGFYIGHSYVVRAETLSFEEGEFVGWTPNDQRIEKFFGE
ncbi:carboxymuconolactone decarboxylase family protein [Haloterrigena sp. SYSU A121-1]|uniref:Carboxymuconolactone decarboxylase family protein n=1 Tax=Haloterrigena gelatinilytica TaxID=2741724 RepID=A0A8J8KDP4_9EURY|nr:carboxymuconolactone decarboxylase family protein [Haloterrigena gelatinilytica]NUB93745.1 carboxymuconolactone decarboxylase family protein [Haloterrigena gelatinilytica]